VAYVFDSHGWEDYDGNRHAGEPTDIDATYGVLVHTYDENNPADSHWFWAMMPEPFDNWDEWDAYIEILIQDVYGLVGE